MGERQRGLHAVLSGIAVVVVLAAVGVPAPAAAQETNSSLWVSLGYRLTARNDGAGLHAPWIFAEFKRLHTVQDSDRGFRPALSLGLTYSPMLGADEPDPQDLSPDARRARAMPAHRLTLKTSFGSWYFAPSGRSTTTSPDYLQPNVRLIGLTTAENDSALGVDLEVGYAWSEGSLWDTSVWTDAFGTVGDDGSSRIGLGVALPVGPLYPQVEIMSVNSDLWIGRGRLGLDLLRVFGLGSGPFHFLAGVSYGVKLDGPTASDDGRVATIDELPLRNGSFYVVLSLGKNFGF